MPDADDARGDRPRLVPPGTIVPVFPLPHVVFFPRTVLPLHIFEPRYREMIRDAASRDRLVAVALLKPGWESDYDGSPPFHEVGTLGRIEDLEPLPDGRFNLKLHGLVRVAFGDVVSWSPYRRARVRPVPETGVPETETAVVARKLDLLASHGCLLREFAGDAAAPIVLDETVSFESAVNAACAGLPVDASARQELLEESDLLARQGRVSEILTDLLQRVLQLKSMRGGADGPGGVN